MFETCAAVKLCLVAKLVLSTFLSQCSFCHEVSHACLSLILELAYDRGEFMINNSEDLSKVRVRISKIDIIIAKCTLLLYWDYLRTCHVPTSHCPLRAGHYCLSDQLKTTLECTIVGYLSGWIPNIHNWVQLGLVCDTAEYAHHEWLARAVVAVSSEDLHKDICSFETSAVAYVIYYPALWRHYS